MKKLNLKLGSIKEMLTKEQMKKIVGGDTIYCDWTYSGAPGCAGGKYNNVPCDTAQTAQECQTNSDSTCGGDDCCNDVDCH